MYEASTRYEWLLREAFGLKLGGKTLDRNGDPAGIADTDRFVINHISEVKAGTAYAMLIMTEFIMDHIEELSDAETDRLEEFTKRIIDASDLKKIDELITEYRSTVIDKYYQVNNGVTALK